MRNPKKQTIFSLILILAIASICQSCYRMPTDDDYSVIPTTNNPSVTCEKQQQIMPSIGY